MFSFYNNSYQGSCRACTLTLPAGGGGVGAFGGSSTTAASAGAADSEK